MPLLLLCALAALPPLLMTRASTFESELASLHHFTPPCSAVDPARTLCVSRSNCSGRKSLERCILVLSLPPDLNSPHQQPHKRPTSLESWGFGAASVGVISLSGVFGVVLWPIMNSKFYHHLMRSLIGLAVGSLTSTALFQLIPEGFELNSDDNGSHNYLPTALFSWLSLWIIFVIEAVTKIVFKKSSPSQKKEPVKGAMSNGVNPGQELSLVESTTLIPNGNAVDIPEVIVDNNNKMIVGCEGDEDGGKVASVAWMVVFGDGIHNFIDGMSIGAGYSQSLATGLGLSLAIVCEEFPHELGDFAILVQSGMSVKRALFYNFLSACTAFLGLAVGLWLGQLKGANFIFAFAGGLFLYISLTHLMPELQAMLKEDSRRGRGSALVALALQNVGMIIGAGAIYTITTYNQVITGESPDV